MERVILLIPEKAKSKLLLDRFPNLKFEIDMNKNIENKIDVLNLTYGSAKKIWWKCLNCKSSYYMSVNSKTCGCNCPYCAGKQVNHTNSLATINPQLASEWHPIKNGDLTPNDVTVSSGKKSMVGR